MKISIPKPCNENWNDMTPEQQGAFCKVCSKVVVDFSAMSDEEVLNYFEVKKEEKTCGRFRASQLSPYEMKINLQQIARKSGFRKIFAASLFIIFSSLFVCKSDTGQPLQLNTVITDTASVVLKIDTTTVMERDFEGLTGDVAVVEEPVMGKPAFNYSDTTTSTGNAVTEEEALLETTEAISDTVVIVFSTINGIKQPTKYGIRERQIKCTTQEQRSEKENTFKGEPMILGGPFYSK